MGLKFTNRNTFLNDDEQELYGALPLVTPTIFERQPPQPVNVYDIWYEESLDDDWVVAYRLALQEQDTRVAVGEIRIFPAAPPREPMTGRWSADVLGSRAPVPAGGIKARTLRQVRLRAFERELSKILKAFRLPRFRAPEQTTTGGKRGRKLDEHRYAKIAVLYGQRYEAGSAHPTADVAKQLRLTPASARAAVSKARRLGLLTATTQGERSGRATPRAFAILKSADRRKAR